MVTDCGVVSCSLLLPLLRSILVTAAADYLSLYLSQRDNKPPLPPVAVISFFTGTHCRTSLCHAGLQFCRWMVRSVGGPTYFHALVVRR